MRVLGLASLLFSQGILAGLFLLAAAELAVRSVDIPGLDRLEKAAVLAYAQAGRLLHGFMAPDDKWRLPVAAADVDPQYLSLLLAYEDANFWRHPGIDVGGVRPGRPPRASAWPRRVGRVDAYDAAGAPPRPAATAAPGKAPGGAAGGSSGRCARGRLRSAGPSAPASGPGRRRPSGAPAGAGRRRRGANQVRQSAAPGSSMLGAVGAPAPPAPAPPGSAAPLPGRRRRPQRRKRAVGSVRGGGVHGCPLSARPSRA